jgi:hypothetical protein
MLILTRMTVSIYIRGKMIRWQNIIQHLYFYSISSTNEKKINLSFTFLCLKKGKKKDIIKEMGMEKAKSINMIKNENIGIKKH